MAYTSTLFIRDNLIWIKAENESGTWFEISLSADQAKTMAIDLLKSALTLSSLSSLAERFIDIEKAVGSIPTGSTKNSSI